MDDLFSQADSPASPIPWPGSAEAQRMTVTSGRKWLGLCETSGLTGCLARTCQGLLTRPWASTECYLTWKAQATPHGRCVFRLVPSTPRTGANGSGLWPTARANEFQAQDVSRLLERRAHYQEKHGNGNGFGLTLQHRVQIDAALWPTSSARDYRHPNSPESQERRNAGSARGQQLVNKVAHLWATPRSTDGKKGGPNQAFGAGGQPLPSQAAGTTPSGSSAPTDSPGALNPAFVHWLMGYPSGWLD